MNRLKIEFTKGVTELVNGYASYTENRFKTIFQSISGCDHKEKNDVK